MTKVDEILETISSMTVLELSELLKAFEEKFGVTAAPVAAAVAAPVLAADAAGGPAEEEQTSFDVLLVEIGEKKIQVIKEVRSLTNLGLKEAKELVDSAPKPVLQGVGREEADKAAESLQAVGASIKVE